MMFNPQTAGKQIAETGFIFVNGVKFARRPGRNRKKNPLAENRLANVCLDC